MKEALNFIRWQWLKFEFWQKMFIFAMILQIFGYSVENQYVVFVGISIVFFYLTKWFIWDRAVESWKNYKKEKEELFDTIKDSHK